VIGLVGGVGCGKSHLARLLHEKHPIEIVEGDKAGHHVLSEPAVKQRVRDAFGGDVFTSSGEVDRSQIGRLVFGSKSEQEVARKKLEQIVHPRISEILKCQVALARSRPGVEAIILDAAILLEAGWRPFCDCVVFIDAPFETRLDRVRNSRGWSREDLQLREESQFPLERKRKEADYEVDNSGNEQLTLSQLETVYSRVVGRRRS
jgi:dephospho-CoA kinase